MQADRLRRVFTILFVAAVAVSGCAHHGAPHTFLPASPSPSSGFLPGPASCISSSPSPLASPIASLLSDAVAITKGVPGGAIGLYDNGAAYTYYWGYADQANATCMGATSIMELGSVTKTFTAALLAMAYNSSLVTPSQNPASLVDTLTNGNLVGAGCSPPPSPSPVPSAAYGVMATMTLSMLATHTSGLPDTPPGEDGLSERSCYSPNQLVAFVESYPSPSPAPTPPHPWLYSNVGFGTIGYVVQGAYKQDWFVLLKQKILTPLAMSSTYNVDAVPSPAAQGYDCGGTKAVAHWSLDPWTAAGSLRSTLPDMMKYLAAAMQQTGTPASISQAMATAQTPVTGAFTDEGAPQAMAWAIPTPSAVPMISKDGATNGFNSWIGMIAPTTGTPAVGVVVLTNRAPVVDPSADPSCAAFAGSPADRIGMYILSHLH